ncbi:MAG: helix-turn-helix transcriptional regulator [Mogibacterium sp.]|nr:helix-turn-helix transcriptional regulator [Mogibacterium sp.]
MSNYRDYLAKALKDPAFAKVWEEDALEFQVISMMIQVRMDSGLTQKDLSELTGIGQPNLSRIENGKCLPDLATLDKVARALGKRLEIRFI